MPPDLINFNLFTKINCNFSIEEFQGQKGESVGGSVLAHSHTLHRYSLVAAAKTRNLWVVLHVNQRVS